MVAVLYIVKEGEKCFMDKQKNNLTATIITTIISLSAIVTIFSGFISNQAKLQVQLANIESNVVNINVKLDKRDDEIKGLTERVIKIEQEVK